MSRVWEEDEVEEATYVEGRLPSHTYPSKSFTFRRESSRDHGAPARFVYKVFDEPGESGGDEGVGEVIEFPLSDGGRIQAKVLIVRDAGRVKELWIHKLRNGKLETTLHLRDERATSFLELMRAIEHVAPDGDMAHRVDSSLLSAVLADPDTLEQVYSRDPEALSRLIERDEEAHDVVALASRRRTVETFRELLTSPERFDEEVLRREVGTRREAVWQQFFEENPWILGASLQGQLLTSWNADKLEQAVAGFSVAGEGKRSDAVLKTAGVIASLVLAEIKLHDARLLENREYRPGVWAPSRELAGGVAQVQATLQRALVTLGERITGKAPDGSEDSELDTFTYMPRTFLIIGSLNQLRGEKGGILREHFRSLELYRRSLRAPEILTFDEVLARAEWAAGLA